MCESKRKRSRGRAVALCGLAVFGTLVLLPAQHLPAAGAADGGPPITRVEEDWELVLNEPGTELTAPQFHTVMSPYADVDSFFVQVSWNYRALPDFVAGGLQLQAQNGDDNLALRSDREEPLSCDAETITWTQQLEAHGTNLVFKVINGQSVSWGAFGGEGTQVQLDAALSNLDTYATSASAANSWVTYGSNRVSLLRITQVRRYSHNELVSTDSTSVIIFQTTPDTGGGAAE